jgi:predicted regulator of Ras-like GTPase activity (Roadblock/LC7/MglB family)
MQDLSTTLSSLRDLEGIVGSFVVSEEGEIVAKDLPAYFDGVLEEVGPRLLRLREALDVAEGDVSSCNIRYAGHKLTIRSIDGALIAVIAEAKINGPALRMAMNLVIRKCSSEDLTAPSSRSSSIPGTAVLLAPPIGAATATPNSAQATRTDPFELLPHARQGGGAPEAGGQAPLRKKREVLFRGKRIG